MIENYIYTSELDFLFKGIFFQSSSTNGKRIIKYGKELTEIYEYLLGIDFPKSNNKVKRKEIININKAFFEEHLPLHDVILIKDGNVITGTPFDIKVKYTRNKLGMVLYKPIVGTDDVKYSEIQLHDKSSADLIGFYAHELVHTQVERKPGILMNYFNKEVLSIFIEKVIMEKMCPQYLDDICLRREEFLKTAMIRYHDNVLVENSLDTDYLARSYIVSTLIANHLFYKYMNLSTTKKREMLEKIEKVFKREMSVETFLNEEHVRFETSKKLKYVK